ncbi:hypothetical protein ACFFTM_07630 [Pseudoduganella plicata]|uniref:Uncharacterized protein n=1 Tax=Pseudoduganella plicata TaxID=321984 RepID=A0A4P7BL38_9BURK|nr:hypothetical protein [Pseudoduganella plicata]QBQ38319.1 hypothetical protein E1742_20680 [Pseudoduganella plicata]GGY81183.1 hypothetical protein GCM10007388_12340 [Pseudoduganella plicata]
MASKLPPRKRAKRKVDQRPQAPARGRAMLMRSLNWLLVAIATIGCGLGCCLLYDGLATGVTTSLNKYGTHHTYSMQLQQGRFWLTMAGHLATTLILAAVAIVFAIFPVDKRH